MDAAGAPEKGALVRDLVPDGAGIPLESLDGGSNGGRQWIDTIGLPLEVELESLRQEHSCSNHPRLRKRKAVLEVRAATGVKASRDSENVSHILDVYQESSVSNSLDPGIVIVGNQVDNALEAPASLKGGSDGEALRMNHVSLTPVEVQSLEQQRRSSSGNSNHPQGDPPKGKELLVGAGECNKSENVSRVVECQFRSDGSVDLDVEKGKLLCNAEATAGRDVETGPRDPHQLRIDAHNSTCRICHMNSATEEIVDLGCACKHDLGQAHKRCADTWFAFRSNWECEICGKIARNVKPPEPMMAQAETVVVLNIHGPSEYARWVCIRVFVVTVVWVIIIIVVFAIVHPTSNRSSHGGTS